MNLLSTILGIIVLLSFNKAQEKANPIEYQILSSILEAKLSIYEGYDQKTYHTVVLLRSNIRNIEEFPIGQNWTDQAIYNDLQDFFGGLEVYELLKHDPEWLTLIKAHNEGSDTPGKWRRFILKDRNIVLKGKSFFKNIGKKSQGWDSFYRKFPKASGFFEASKPIIRGNKALIYVASLRGSLNGVGQFFFLEKNEEWKILAGMEIWVS